ncbi:hypothetical protein GJAV_G00094120 [Gymnothorax javanicus]|nr:hypothetical protein GJAV_G00094120 [Gymnothorax javanicus]
MELLLFVAMAFSPVSVVRVGGAEEVVFAPEEGFVRLDVQRYKEIEFRAFYWNVNRSAAVLEYIHKNKELTIFGGYKIRTKFDKSKLSLLLKNTRLTDNGIYTAQIIDSSGRERDIATYRLIVKEAPPIPEVGVAFLSSAGGVCSVSVNCSAGDTWARYTCDHAHCTQKRITSRTGVNLSVIAADGTIYCISSNQAHIMTHSKSTKNICSRVDTKEEIPGFIFLVIFFFIFIISVAINFILIICRRKRPSGAVADVQRDVLCRPQRGVVASPQALE